MDGPPRMADNFADHYNADAAQPQFRMTLSGSMNSMKTISRFPIRAAAMLAAMLGGPFAFSSLQGAVYQEVDGQVVIEAEHFDTRTKAAAGGRYWHIAPDEDGLLNPNDFTPVYTEARGGKYMHALPDIQGSDYIHNTVATVDADPHLDFRIRIATPGTYRLFLRWAAIDSRANSIYAQILELRDGVGGAQADWYRYEIPDAWVTGTFSGYWRADGEPEIVTADSVTTGDPVWTIAAPGFYTIRITYREDGCALDALALRLSSLPAIDPYEVGPAESSLSSVYPPSIVSVTPATSAAGVLPDTDISATLQDGAPMIVDTNSITLTLDGQNLAPLQIVKQAAITTATWDSTALFPGGSTHTVQLRFQDTTGLAYTNTWQFTALNYVTLPAASAYPMSSMNSSAPGFQGKIVQAPYSVLLSSTVARANAHLANLLIDPATSQPYLNMVVTTTNTAVDWYGWVGFKVNPDGTFNEAAVINYSADATYGSAYEIGFFTATTGQPDANFPGLPGSRDDTYIDYTNGRSFSIEVLAFIELAAGWHVLGVHNDDGVELAIHPNDARDVFRKGIIRFDTNAGATEKATAVYVETNGLYSVRLVLAQYDSVGLLEFFSSSPTNTSQRTLINDRTQPQAVRAWRSLNVPTRPYVTRVSPEQGATGVELNSPIQVAIANLGAVVPALKVNGQPVTYSSSPSGSETLLTYTPATPFSAGKAIHVEIDCAGAVGTWDFATKAGRKALMITGGGTVNPADGWIRTRLASEFGLDVTVVADNAVTTNSAQDCVLVLNSSTVNSGGPANDDFEVLPIPLVNWEAANLDDFRMVDYPYSGKTGNGATTSQVSIVNTNHPMAAGLSAGLHAFCTSPTMLHYGVIPANGTPIAVSPANANHCSLFAIEEGAQIADGTDTFFTHPARRVHIGFTGNDGAASYNDVGIALFDAAIRWVMKIELPTEIRFDPVALQNGMLTIGWTGGGTLYEAPAVTGPWSPAASQNNPQTVAASGIKFYRVQRP